MTALYPSPVTAEKSEPRTRSDRRTNDARILQAAGRLLADDPNVSISAIAEAAGVARLTVYRRYPHREAIAAALQQTVEAEILDALEGFPGWAAGPSAFGVLVNTMTATAHRYPVVLRDHRVESASVVDRRLVEILADGQRAGVLRADVDAELLNGCLFALIRAHHQLRSGADPADAAASVADILLRGVKAGH